MEKKDLPVEEIFENDKISYGVLANSSGVSRRQEIVIVLSENKVN